MTEINWTLLQNLAEKPHKHLNIAADGTYGVMLDGTFDTGNGGVGEVMQEARTVQHLCDMAGIPEGKVYDAHIDARVYQLMLTRLRLAERLNRISAWHSQETADGGMVGDFCIECGTRWPCETRRMADGTHEDLNESDDPSRPAEPGRERAIAARPEAAEPDEDELAADKGGISRC